MRESNAAQWIIERKFLETFFPLQRFQNFFQIHALNKLLFTDPHTELDNLISTELDNCLISTELDSEISTQLDNCQISTQLDKINFT